MSIMSSQPGGGARPEVGGPPQRAQVTAAVWKARLLSLEAAVNRRTASATSRPWLMLAAALLFVAVSAVSFASLPHGLHIHWLLLPLIVLVLAPLTVLENAAEFRVMGGINGHRIGWGPAIRLTILATAANLLPLPGGVAIRTQALRQRGSTYRHALGANVAAMLTWIAMGSIAIAILMAANSSRWVAVLVLAVVGACSLAGVTAILRPACRGSHVKYLGQLIAVESLMVIVGGTRIFLAFRLIGLTATATQAIALTAAAIFAAAIGIFPGGLGIRELMAGVIATAVSLPGTEAVAATASDRVAVQLSIALFTLMLLPKLRRDRRAEPAGLKAADPEHHSLAPAPSSRGKTP
jgi:uncharacterized membrane protein YbhN (UPF0104 family)